MCHQQARSCALALGPSLDETLVRASLGRQAGKLHERGLRAGVSIRYAATIKYAALICVRGTCVRTVLTCVNGICMNEPQLNWGPTCTGFTGYCFMGYIYTTGPVYGPRTQTVRAPYALNRLSVTGPVHTGPVKTFIQGPYEIGLVRAPYTDPYGLLARIRATLHVVKVNTKHLGHGRRGAPTPLLKVKSGGRTKSY